MAPDTYTQRTSAPATLGPREVRGQVPARDTDWDALAPRGLYVRAGKPLLRILLLLCVLPPAALLSVPIALLNWASFRDRRRILFSQPRVGLHGERFSILKFRTMREVRGRDFDSWRSGQDGLRVTRFGRFLRNAHLDELPQLLNVLKGEMDFIGPRPEMVEIHRWACAEIPGFEERNAVLPGITGYAQVTQGYTGMDAEAYADKLHADQEYRVRLSLRFDLEILVRTGLWMLRGRGWRWRRNELRPVPPASRIA